MKVLIPGYSFCKALLMSDKRVVIDHFQSVRDGGSDHGPARFAGAALPARPRPLSPQPAPEALSSAVRPERRGGLSPSVAGAVSASRSDATRKAYSAQ